MDHQVTFRQIRRQTCIEDIRALSGVRIWSCAKRQTVAFVGEGQIRAHARPLAFQCTRSFQTSSQPRLGVNSTPPHKLGASADSESRLGPRNRRLCWWGELRTSRFEERSGGLTRFPPSTSGCFACARAAAAAPGSRETEPLCVSAVRRRSLAQRSAVLLAGGTRERGSPSAIAITAPFPGAAVKRSRRCTRTRVPLRVAMLTLSGCHFH
jgi:hypothetical protein